MTQAYDHLSEWFERLNDDCGYEQWSQYFLKGLSVLGVGKRGLEVGCGSGAFTRALAKAGYEMTGCDLSAPMLSKALSLARDKGLKINFVQADAAKLSLGKFDFLLSPNDCYNYIPHSNLRSAFRHAAASLKKGGIFWFDISSEYKLREKIANNVFADDRDEVTYLVFNHLFADRVEMDVTLFVRRLTVHLIAMTSSIRNISIRYPTFASCSKRRALNLFALRGISARILKKATG